MHGRPLGRWTVGGTPAAALLLVAASAVGPWWRTEAAVDATAPTTVTAAVATATTAPANVPVVVRTAPSTAPAVVVHERPGDRETARAGALRPVVILYGDSLAWEAEEFFRWALADRPELTVVTRTWGGTAICDFLDRMRDDALTLAPGVVVVEFSGNSLTDCMRDGTGNHLTGQPYLDKYQADAEAVLAVFLPGGSDVIFAGAPISGVPAIDTRNVRIRSLYQRVAARHPGATYIDAGAAVLDGGRWTLTLPCLAGEPCNGGTDDDGAPVNVVRSPDGVHFCPGGAQPDNGVTSVCGVWSSGAFRFAMAMATPVLQRYGS